MIHAAGVREWRNLDAVDTEPRKSGVFEPALADTTPHDVLPADQEEAIFKLRVVRYASCIR